ncbi:MAG: hypothetical protein JNK82_22410 [Myxococcaceae bacterium]|nr:hypothetical protein [Myxococcaceae bacterium]
MSEPADAFAEQVRRIAGELALLDEKLDFSKESLATLEERLKEGHDADFARAAGAYLAEVVMRRAPVKLRWVEAKRVYAAWNDTDNPWLLATPKNLVFAVLGKPLKRDTTLVDFADKVQHLCSREASSV